MLKISLVRLFVVECIIMELEHLSHKFIGNFELDFRKKWWVNKMKKKTDHLYKIAVSLITICP